MEKQANDNSEVYVGFKTNRFTMDDIHKMSIDSSTHSEVNNGGKEAINEHFGFLKDDQML